MEFKMSAFSKRVEFQSKGLTTGVIEIKSLLL